MYLLAFESSCDDTSVALLQDGKLISMHTHTQSEHVATLGVVPEIAARLHADHVFDLMEKVLTDGKIEISDIDIFAATSEPGLVPSLLIGKTVAKTLATSHKKRLIWVNHIEGHIFSVLLDRDLSEIQFPSIVLSASGGHNDLYLWRSLYEIEKLGGTMDDSAGESMDKVGRMMGLPFPAGRYIDELAQKYDEKLHINIPDFPLVLPEGNLNFSFSGLKSAALREIKKTKLKTENLPAGQAGGKLPEHDMIEISYAYQKTITEILFHRTIEATKKFNVQSICIVGGVSANSALRELFKKNSKQNGIPYYLPKSIKYCGDNAAMIGMRAWYEYNRFAK